MVFKKLKIKYHDFKEICKQIVCFKIPRKLNYNKTVYLLQAIDLDERNDRPLNSKLKIQRIEQGHLNILREFSKKYGVSTGSTPIIKIEHYLDNQFNGFMALLDGEIIGYVWWVDNKIVPERNHPDINLYEMKLKDGDVYGFDTYIAPLYRGGGNSIKFMNVVGSELNKMGYKRIYDINNPKNIAASWTYKLLGLKPIKRITMYSFFNSVMYVNKRIFISNNDQHPYHPRGCRMILSFKHIKLASK